MTYVDEMRLVPLANPWKYRESCHLMADTEAELEAFARRLGLRPSYRHNDHYDLTGNKRRQAVQAGAIEITQRQMVEIRRTLQEVNDE